KRLAIFVEGYTELLFVEKLVEEIAGQNNVLIDLKKIRGGSKVPRKMITIKAGKDNGQKYYVLLIDCGGDEQVKSRIMQEHDNLTQAGYSKLIGVRDVSPFLHTDIPKLQSNLPKYIKTKLAPVNFILSIMEIEAWFLAEISHFSKIDTTITIEAINARLGFDIEKDNIEQRSCPSQDLHECYSIAGKAYIKSQANITVNVLDYEAIYIDLRTRINYLDILISDIDSFLK
ncbi:MAG: hypothetical protein JNM06_23385, partial [Blastocatellia bacterium]|nr:hypothetical protein [Blastocatellia bacterium]